MPRVEPRRARTHARTLAQQLRQPPPAGVRDQRLLARLYRPARVLQPEADVGIATGADVLAEASHLLERLPADGAVRGLHVRPATGGERVVLSPLGGDGGEARHAALGGLVLDASTEH